MIWLIVAAFYFLGMFCMFYIGGRTGLSEEASGGAAICWPVAWVILAAEYLYKLGQKHGRQ